MKIVRTVPIVRTYYEALEEGKVLGRKCPRCGHIEWPPYLACNACGNLDTEWVDITNIRAKVLQVQPPLKVFPEHEWKAQNHGYMVIHIQFENGDEYATSLVNVADDRYQELHDNRDKLVVKPVIVQGEDTKLCVWELDEPGAVSLSEILAKEAAEKAARGEVEEAEEVIDVSENVSEETEVAEEAADQEEELVWDEVAETVFECASVGYEMDMDGITFDSDIRLDMSNQSIKMIVMISEIEDELGITIEITEAAELVTMGDFVRLVKRKLKELD